MPDAQGSARRRATTSCRGRWHRRSPTSSSTRSGDPPSFREPPRLLDSTPPPCGAPREPVKRSKPAGCAAYG